MKFLFALGFLGLVTISLWVATAVNASHSPVKEIASVTSKAAALDKVSADALNVPVAILEQTIFDFGVLDPSRPGAHVFTIQNTGDASLTIQEGRKSCKCVSLRLIDKEIQPGQLGRVEVKWTAMSKTGEFRESYSVYTNDPAKSEIRLTVKGEFNVGFWSTVGNFRAGLVEQGTPYSCFTHLYSQQWDNIYIREITSSMDNLQWSIEDDPIGDISELEATASKTLKMRCPEFGERGAFKHYVRITASPAEDSPEADWLTIDLTFEGTVIGKYLVTSEKFDYKNALDFKSVRNDQEHAATLMIKVAAKDKVLPSPTFRSFPDGLELKWTPINPEKGVYRADVRIPKGLPAGDYQQAKNEGWIRLSFDHPEVDQIQIPMVLRLYAPSTDVEY